MPYRRIVFANGEFYHLVNRSIAQEPIFKSERDYHRALALIEFYRHANPSLRYSHFVRLPQKKKSEFLQQLEKRSNYLVEIVAFCLMPNHIHFLIKQLQNKGISIFMANVQNSYARYFNTKHKRIGSLFQAMFRAVRIETDEQLIHVSRYIHLNPVSSYLIKINQLASYAWSSFPDYLGKRKLGFVNPEPILGLFASREDYQKFVFDQADYQQELKNLEHLILEKQP